MLGGKRCFGRRLGFLQMVPAAYDKAWGGGGWRGGGGKGGGFFGSFTCP